MFAPPKPGKAPGLTAVKGWAGPSLGMLWGGFVSGQSWYPVSGLLSSQRWVPVQLDDSSSGAAVGDG